MADSSPRHDSKPSITDEQLLARYRAGDDAAFDALVRRYQHELFHFLIRFTGSRAAADDVFQEAFLQVHLSADTFDIDRRFKPWLFTIASNKARDYLRRQACRATTTLSAPVDNSKSGTSGGGGDEPSFLDFMQADLPMPDQALEQSELTARVRQSIDAMPNHLRQILLLSYFEKFSYQEIAEVLGVPLGTVKSRLHTAVANFAERWKLANPSPENT
jgi:RNA polymerase sigma-70 factor (ECF subfamily)